MSEMQPPTNPNVTIHGNWLYADGRMLRTNVLRHSKEKAAVSSEELARILSVGRFAILNGIINFRFPGADTTPSIWTLHLGTNRQVDGREGRLFTEAGYKNGGINEAIGEIKEPFRPYWNAIKDAGFLPEVRRTFGRGDGGAWMLLRKPTFMQVSKDWLNYHRAPDVEFLLERIGRTEKDHPKAATNRDELFKQLFIRNFRSQAHEYIDSDDDELRKAEFSPEKRATYRARQQVGSELAVIAIKQTLLFRQEIDDDVEDVLTYARNSDAISDGAVLAIENAAY